MKKQFIFQISFKIKLKRRYLRYFKKFILINKKCKVYKKDNGHKFVNLITDSSFNNFGMKHIIYSSYNPQTNEMFRIYT